MFSFAPLLVMWNMVWILFSHVWFAIALCVTAIFSQIAMYLKIHWSRIRLFYRTRLWWVVVVSLVPVTLYFVNHWLRTLFLETEWFVIWEMKLVAFKSLYRLIFSIMTLKTPSLLNHIQLTLLTCSLNWVADIQEWYSRRRLHHWTKCNGWDMSINQQHCDWSICSCSFESYREQFGDE